MQALDTIGSKYHQVRSWMDFLGFIRDPLSTEKIFSMSNSFKKSTNQEMIDKLMEKAYSDPRLTLAYEQKYFPVLPPMPELAKMPEDSLGFHFYSFMKKWNLDVDLFPPAVLDTREDYLKYRVYHNHDLWHVLTGYTPDLVDEMALQAFSVGQYDQPLSLLIISGGLIHLLQKNPEEATTFLKAVVEGFESGKAAKKLLVEPVIERLHEPIEVVRRDLGISGKPGFR